MLSLNQNQLDSQKNSTSQENSSSSRKHVRQKDKIMAACAGGILTSLTMTPLDVIKTRLQTQSPHTTNSSSASTSCINSGLLSTKRSTTPAHLQSSQACCKQPSQLNNTLSNETILRRLNPRALNPPCASLSLSLNGSSPTHLCSPLHSSSSCAWIPSTIATRPLIPSSFRPPHPSTVPASGIIDSILNIVQHEGVGTLWRGIGPTLVMAIPAQAVYMVGYDTLRAKLIELGPKFGLEDRLGASTGWYRTTIAPLLAGALSRSFVAILFCPLELLRTRLQSAPATITPLTQFNHNQSLSHLSIHQSKSSSSTLILKSTLSTVKRSGISSLYRGLSATLWRDVPFSGIYWSTYEICRKTISNGNGFGESIPTKHHHDGSSAQEALSVRKIATQSFLAGSISGCFAAVATNPFDVIKTRRQASKASDLGMKTPEGTVRMIYTIGRDEGLKGLMKGLSPRLAKIIPSCGIMIASYEGLAQVFAQY